VFAQSSFGVVTRAGFWLMPAPQSLFTLTMHLPEPEDIGWLVDVLTPLRIRRVIDHPVSATCYMASATTTSQRGEWYQGRGALPDSVVREIMAKRGAGWWNFSIRLDGDPEVNEAHLRIIRSAFAPHTRQEFEITRWSADEASIHPAAPAPSVFALQIVNWYGGRGGHLGFSPVLPPDGARVLEQLNRTRRRYAEFGIDYSGTFYVDGRHVTNINLILFDRDDADMATRVRSLFGALVKDSAAAGYGEYRTHLSFMDAVAGTFDYNHHALLRLSETVKDALDPNGIIAPGKSGIWPRVYRNKRSST